MFVIVLYNMGHFVKIYDINKLIVIEDFFFLIINDMVSITESTWQRS